MSQKDKTYKGKPIEGLDENPEILAGSSKGNPFTVPDGYFDRLPVMINERLKEKKENHFYRIVELMKFKWRLALVAAGFVTVVLVSLLWISNYSNDALPDISDISISDILQDNPDFFNSLEESDIINIIFANLEDEQNFINDLGFSDITDDELIEYLSNDDIETDELLYNL